MWSRTSTSRSEPASRISFVIATSSALGVGSPEGWLWTMIMAGQFSRTASRKRSAMRTWVVLRVPLYTSGAAITWFFVFRRTTRRCSCSSSAMSARSRLAMSCGEWTKGRSSGWVASRRRPSSRAARTCDAFASPTAGSPHSSPTEARALGDSFLAGGAGGQDDRQQLGVGEGGGAGVAQPLPRALAGWEVADEGAVPDGGGGHGAGPSPFRRATAGWWAAGPAGGG